MTIRIRWLLAAACAVALGGCTDDGPVRAVGQLESDRVELVAEYAEPIIERTVAEGDTVTAGQVILRQDPARLSARVDEQAARLEQARARLAELTRGPRGEQIDAARANVAGAREDLEFRRLEYARAKTVLERELAAPDTVDRAKAALDAARASLEFHEAKLSELLAGTTVEELRQAEAAVQQAEAAMTAATLDRERLVITAPADGTVDSLLFEMGERPAAGRPVAILLTGPNPYARAYVSESLRARVGPGDVARVYVDGLDEAIPGRVRWVASEAAFTPYFALTERDRGRLTYLAKIDIERDGRRLPDGVPVEVEFPGASGPN